MDFDTLSQSRDAILKAYDKQLDRFYILWNAARKTDKPLDKARFEAIHNNLSLRRYHYNQFSLCRLIQALNCQLAKEGI